MKSGNELAMWGVGSRDTKRLGKVFWQLISASSTGAKKMANVIRCSLSIFYTHTNGFLICWDDGPLPQISCILYPDISQGPTQLDLLKLVYVLVLSDVLSLNASRTLRTFCLSNWITWTYVLCIFHGYLTLMVTIFSKQKLEHAIWKFSWVFEMSSSLENTGLFPTVSLTYWTVSIDYDDRKTKKDRR